MDGIFADPSTDPTLGSFNFSLPASSSQLAAANFDNFSGGNTTEMPVGWDQLNAWLGEGSTNSVQTSLQ